MPALAHPPDSLPESTDSLLARRKLTYADYAAIPPDGQRHEIIDGVEYMSPAPRTLHQRLVGRLYFALQQHAQQHGLGEVFVAPFDVRLDAHTFIQPDLVFVSDARLGIVDEVNCKGAPDLVVEVLSPSTRQLDLTTKRERYAKAGVGDYWLVDGDEAELRVLRLNAAGVYEQIAILGRDDTLEAAVPSGFSLALNELFV